MKLHVEVTAEDIAKGRPKDGNCCAVARAIKRAAQASGIEISDLEVDTEDVYLTDGEFQRLHGELDTDTARFIEQFDLQAGVEPFAMDVTFDVVEDEI